MKLKATILIFIWGLLIVQPGFSNFGGKPAYIFCKKNDNSSASCSKNSSKKSSCSKEKDEKPGEREDEDGNCNPTLGCSSGNFYTFVNTHVIIAKIHLAIQKLVLSNDNRIATQLSECWHPPEVIS